MQSRVLVIPLCKKVRLVTAPAVNDFTNPAERAYLELDVPDITWLLPHAEELTAVTLAENQSANLRWGVFGYSGFDRGSEGAVFQIGAAVSANGSLRHTPYTTLTSFLLESRLLLGYGYATGSAGAWSGVVSAALIVKTVGM